MRLLRREDGPQRVELLLSEVPALDKAQDHLGQGAVVHALQEAAALGELALVLRDRGEVEIALPLALGGQRAFFTRRAK